jgi:hypothetical protein
MPLTTGVMRKWYKYHQISSDNIKQHYLVQSKAFTMRTKYRIKTCLNTFLLNFLPKKFVTLICKNSLSVETEIIIYYLFIIIGI